MLSGNAEKIQTRSHAKIPNHSQGHYKEDNSNYEENKDVKDVNEVENVKNQCGSRNEFDGNDNNKNENTNTHPLQPSF